LIQLEPAKWSTAFIW